MIKIPNLFLLACLLVTQNLHAREESPIVKLDLRAQNVSFKSTPAGDVRLEVDDRVVGQWRFSHPEIMFTGRVGLQVAQILDQALDAQISRGQRYVAFDKRKMDELVQVTRPENLRRFPEYGSMERGYFKTVTYNSSAIERAARSMIVSTEGGTKSSIAAAPSPEQVTPPN